MNLDRKKLDVTKVIVASTLILSISIGTRASFGLFLGPIGDSLNLNREVFSFAIAIQMLAWGGGQPFFGMLADLYGSARIVIIGAFLYAGGLIVMAYASGPIGLYLGAGVLVGLGTSAMGFAIILSPVVRSVSEKHRSLALGIAAAGGSFGQFMLAMISGWLIAIEGWSNALLIITLIVSCAGLLAFGVRGKPTTSYPDVSLSLRSALRDAFHHRGYWLLNFGFFVCGFHVTFVATHLPSYLSDLGYTGMLAATAIGAIGLANILGTLSCGLLGGIYSKKYILSILYFLRSIVIAVFIFIPISETSVIVFAALLGLLWLGTVPLTSGLVVQIFGSRYLGTLFGIVFFSHQIGGFFGAWLGGKLYDSTNSYDLAWYIAILLGVFAAIIHLPINDRPFKYAN